ncbi:MAG: phasin family protein [Paracoccaceae bacterium]|nr:phasin family protein [Paracoccaceae bacterium]MDE3121802.1 phasin family protein [Paracoccaceae bacterium]MDE3237708.1 phasin family protein [Paracoccaceae bacterium]
MAINKERTKAATAKAAEITATMTDLQRNGLGAAAWMSAAMFETVTALGNEVVQFVAERITEDVRTQHALMHCKDFNEMQRIQTEFLRKALEQYSAESGRLVQLGAGVMTSAMPKRAKDAGPV